MNQPWIRSSVIDSLCILAPGVAASLLAWWLCAEGQGGIDTPVWAWVVLVVGIDVAHVYATLYRTYLDGRERHSLGTWLWLTPLACWLCGVLLYSLSAGAFWTLLAYLAVFHFVRQQYGFVMLYARNEQSLPAWCRHIDKLAIYAATLGPLLYWHTHLPRAFVWFVEGDFIALPSWCWTVGAPLYGLVLLAYFFKEVWLAHSGQGCNLPRNGVVCGTAFSWFVGIVVANGDLVFTLTNVVAHGLPYIALTTLYKRAEDVRRARPHSWFSARYLPASIGLLCLFAYLEEGLWDGLVWREHGTLFALFGALPAVHSSALLALLVPLLTVPQATHYVLDALIWRMRSHPDWQRSLLWLAPAR